MYAFTLIPKKRYSVQILMLNLTFRRLKRWDMVLPSVWGSPLIVNIVYHCASIKNEFYNDLSSCFDCDMFHWSNWLSDFKMISTNKWRSPSLFILSVPDRCSTKRHVFSHDIAQSKSVFLLKKCFLCLFWLLNIG